MVQLRLVIVAAFLVSVAMVAQAQDSPDSPLMTDPQGDVSASLLDMPLGNPGGHYDHLDLTAAWVAEEPEAFTFTLQVADLTPPGDEAMQNGGILTLQFRHHDTEFRIRIVQCTVCIPSGYYFAELHARAEGTQEWSFLRFANIASDALSADRAAGTLSWRLPRDDLLDQNGAAPHPGRILDQFQAWSHYILEEINLQDDEGRPLIDPPYRVADRMPDTGVADAHVAVQLGLVQSGNARLSSPEPFRASNGEATTFLFQVNATNVGLGEATYFFQPTRVPGQWDVTLPVESVSLEPGRSVLVPVLVTTPFAHQHGGLDSFILEMTDITDRSSVGRVELGIRYLEVPQPAGHHDTVYLHARPFGYDNILNDVLLGATGGDVTLFMNTLQDDPTATAVSAPAWSGGTSVTQEGELRSSHRWMIELDPTLRMGLDFDTDGTGHLVVPVETTTPMLDARLSGVLAVVRPDNSNTFTYPWGFRNATELAIFDSGDPVDIGANGRHTFELDLVLTEDAGLIPYRPDQNLVLHVEIGSLGPQTFLGPTETRPRMLTGGWMQLPLFEYRDPIDSVFTGLQGPSLSTPVTARMANPGSVVLFDVDVTAPVGAAGTYHIELAGRNHAWARLHTHHHLELPANGQIRVPIAVHIPKDAVDGEMADLFIQAVHTDDDLKRGMLRVVVEVDTAATHPDDAETLAALTGDAKESAGPAPILVVCLLILGGVLRHRRP